MVIPFLDFLKRKKTLTQEIFLRDTEFVILDTELTGLDEKKDSIISIGAIRMRGGRIVLSDMFYEEARPQSALKKESITIHGFTPSDLTDKPDIADIAEKFSSYCSGSVLVGHFIGIDIAFLNRLSGRLNRPHIVNPSIDTFYLIEWLSKRFKGRRFFSYPINDPRLYEAARRFDIPIQGAHNSLMDAFITAQLFQRLMPLLSEAGINTLTEVIEIQNPSKGGDRFRASIESMSF